MLGLSSGLVACDKCEGINCAPCPPTNDVRFSFDQDTLQHGFGQAEIRGAYAVRYAPPGFATPLDTVRGGKRETDFHPYYFSLQTLSWPVRTPFLNLSAYNYRFVLPVIGRTYDLSELDVKSEATSGGCCNCGFNSRRRFVLNGQAVVADGGGPDDATVLRR